jgi:hypothetical protein
LSAKLRDRDWIPGEFSIMLDKTLKGASMRLISAFCGLAVLALAHTAHGQTISPVSFSPEFQVLVDEELGAREGDYLRETVTRRVAAALSQRGVTVGQSANVTIEISIIDADPNRPTMEQQSQNLGLDGLRSVSIGGAELQAVLRGSDGRVLSEVTHRRYDHSLADVFGSDTWHAARRAIGQFANKVADAYVESAG